MTEQPVFHLDCRHYRADRPCLPHKQTGVQCRACGLYDPVRERILIVKLGAMGDVLRTTALLDPLRRAHPGCAIEWMTRPESVDLVRDVVDRVLTPDPAGVEEIRVREFDQVINLDLGRDSAALAAAAGAKSRAGYALRPDGAVVAVDDRGREWFAMSLDDGLKRANTRTYQDHMMAVLGLDPPAGPVRLVLTDADRAASRRFVERHHWEAAPVVGFNPGAGGRWRWKAWPPERFLELGRRLFHERNANVVLLFGPGESELRKWMLDHAGFPVLDTGFQNPVRQFMGLVDLCDVLVTGDTLALHIGVGLGKQVIALFGPTSAAEIDLYGRGEKLTGAVPCLGCYHTDCEVRPSCMETLEVETVFRAVVRRMEMVESAPAERDEADDVS